MKRKHQNLLILTRFKTCILLSVASDLKIYPNFDVIVIILSMISCYWSVYLSTIDCWILDLCLHYILLKFSCGTVVTARKQPTMVGYRFGWWTVYKIMLVRWKCYWITFERSFAKNACSRDNKMAATATTKWRQWRSAKGRSANTTHKTTKITHGKHEYNETQHGHVRG